MGAKILLNVQTFLTKFVLLTTIHYMKNLRLLSTSALIALSTLSLSADNLLVKGLPKIGNWSDISTWIVSTGKSTGAIPTANDSVGTIDISRGVNVNGNYTIKALYPSRYTGAKTGTIIPFIMNGAQSLTIDAQIKKARNANVIVADFTTVKNDKDSTPMKEQGIIFKGGTINIQNSGTPSGVVSVILNAQKNPKTNPDFLARLIFDENSRVFIKNTFNVATSNSVYRRDFGYQNSAIDFLGKTNISAESNGKRFFKDFRVARVSNDTPKALMTVNIGNATQLSKPLKDRAFMTSGRLSMASGSALNVYGTYIVNGGAKVQRTNINVHKGAKLTFTSEKLEKAIAFENSPETIVNIAGTMEILNNKYPATSADFKGGIYTIEDGGFLKVQGNGNGGLCYVKISTGSINIKKGGKLYARNMLRFGDNGIVRLFGENQISAVEPANKKCRMMVDGRNARLFLFANQDMDGFAFQKSNAELIVTLGDEVSSLKFVKLVNGKWFPKATITFNNFRNGVVKVSEPNDAAIVATNIKAEGWKNFRFEAKDGAYVLMADKE